MLIARGLVAGMAASVVPRMVSRRGRDRLSAQLLGIAMIGVFAAVFLVARPEWGAAGFRFLFESLLDRVCRNRGRATDPLTDPAGTGRPAALAPA